MPQWFLRFSEFPEFNESSAPFRESPIEHLVKQASAAELQSVEESLLPGGTNIKPFLIHKAKSVEI